MKADLLNEVWEKLDNFELMHVLHERIGHLGQYDGDSTNKFYLPLADESCRIVLTFRDNKISAIKPGPAFDADEWDRISEEIKQSIINGSQKVGREYSFSSFRVQGSWRGDHSGVQILPPPDDAPRADFEMAQHPFILEFPIKVNDLWPITNYRRAREHRNLTLLLNVLLAGRTSLQPRRSEHFWAIVSFKNNDPDLDFGHFYKSRMAVFVSSLFSAARLLKRRLFNMTFKNSGLESKGLAKSGLFASENGQSRAEIKWVQQCYFAKLGEPVNDELSPPTDERLEEVEPEEYYGKVGHDGKGLRVPADLDESICLYLQLSPKNRAKFDRAIFWMDMASRQWTISVSSSFASLVSAIESLTDQGAKHKVYCDKCKDDRGHDSPGATANFRAFFEKYAPGTSLRKRRSDMYSLRSGILHGSNLMQLDQHLDFGHAPPWWNEYELHTELWSLTRIALRNWLKNPPTT